MRCSKVSTLLIPLAAILCLGKPATSAQQTPNGEAFDTATVEGFWSDLDETWATRDPDGFARLFAEDASIAFIDRGLWLEGRAAIHRFFTQQFLRQRPGLRHLTDLRQLRRLADGVVAVDGEVRVVADSPRNTVADLRRFAIAVVMARDADGWRVRILRVYTLTVQTDRPPTGQSSREYSRDP